MTALAEYIEAKQKENLSELIDFLKIPSVSTKSEHKGDIEKAANWVAEKLRSAGMKKVEILPTGGHPMVYAEWLEAPGKPTLLFYGHYDVQPAEPLELWTSPAFDPAVRNGNLYGRGTADDKGQVFMHLKAIEGDVTAKTSGGSIHAERLTGKSVVKTSGGSIHAAGIKGSKDIVDALKNTPCTLPSIHRCTLLFDIGHAQLAEAPISYR